MSYRSSSWKLVAIILDIGICEWALVSGTLFPDVWFQKESLTNKRRSLEHFIKKGSCIENRKHVNILTEWKASVFDYTLIYPQGCTAVLTDDFT